MRKITAFLATALIALSAPLLTACSSASAELETAADHPLGIEGAWAKSTDDTFEQGSSMTSLFGTLTNASGEDLNVVSAHTSIAGMVELHEVSGGTMQPVDGGFVVPANGSLELVPGGLHIMLMSLKEPLLAGDTIAVTLTLADGATVDFQALVKDTAGANESYEGSDSSDTDAEQHTHEAEHDDTVASS